jgi:hypothetical protein
MGVLLKVHTNVLIEMQFARRTALTLNMAPVHNFAFAIPSSNPDLLNCSKVFLSEFPE